MICRWGFKMAEQALGVEGLRALGARVCHLGMATEQYRGSGGVSRD